MDNKNKRYQYLNGVKFKGFHPVNWDNVFQYIYIYHLESGQHISFLKGILQIVASSIFNRKEANIRIRENSRSLIYQTWSTRKVNEYRINNLAELINADTMIYGKWGKIQWDIVETFNLLFILIPSWVVSLFYKKIPTSIKLAIFIDLIRLRRFDKCLNTALDLDKYSLSIVYFDTLPRDGYLSELFKYLGKKTATLQHGQFVAYRSKEEIHCAVELRSSNSDVFLCWNQMTYDEAIKAGLKHEHLKIVGILPYINAKRMDILSPNNHMFGVVLGHPSYEDENLELIKAANLLANTIGFDYQLKLHPNYDEHYFDDKVDKNYFKGIVRIGIDMSDYAALFEFSIIGSTSVFVELVFIKHPMLRYSSMDITDKFRDVKQGNIFHRPLQIYSCYQKMISSGNTNSLFEYLCFTDKVADSYRDFLNTYSNTNEFIQK